MTFYISILYYLREVKNINGDMVFSIQLTEIKVESPTFFLEYEKYEVRMDEAFIKLKKCQDYVVYEDGTSLFLKITKKLECGEKYHLRIKFLDTERKNAIWVICFQPKGSAIT